MIYVFEFLVHDEIKRKKKKEWKLLRRQFLYFENDIFDAI